jgi:hypothetical protein
VLLLLPKTQVANLSMAPKTGASFISNGPKTAKIESPFFAINIKLIFRGPSQF